MQFLCPRKMGPSHMCTACLKVRLGPPALELVAALKHLQLLASPLQQWHLRARSMKFHKLKAHWSGIILRKRVWTVRMMTRRESAKGAKVPVPEG